MKKNTFSYNLGIGLALAALLGFLTISGGIFAQQAKEEKKEEASSEVTGWRIKDFQPYIKAMRDLEKFNVKYADDRLKLARDEYAKAIDILEDMERDVARLIEKNEKGKFLNERWHWQEVDRLNQLRRQVTMRKTEAKTRALTYLTRSINTLDEIEERNQDFIVKNEAYKTFKIRLFQVYVSIQHDLHNFRPCIPILERYIKIDDKTKDDVWAYKYLASSYAYVEKVLSQSRGVSEDQVIYHKQKKNEYLLTAVRLEYGLQSPEFKHMKEVVDRDEMKTERINEFR
jgi:predicted metal-dependent hydrolase